MTTDFPTASVGSSQAPTAAVEKSHSASNTEIQTLPVAPALRRGTPFGGHDIVSSFESARSLFAELTPARLDLLDTRHPTPDTRRRVGPCSVYALATSAERNDSSVHTDVACMEQLDLIDRADAGEVLAPYESVEIVVPLARAVA